jgi:hypothetical protein
MIGEHAYHRLGCLFRYEIPSISQQATAISSNTTRHHPRDGSLQLAVRLAPD